MGFTALNSSDIGTGKPVTTPMLATIKNDLDYLYGNIAGGIETGGMVRNGGFEIDADGDGLPDSVTISLYTGGGATLVTTASTYASPLQGGKSLAISKPSGVGNGGAAVTFDYMPCSTKSFWASFLVNCNTTGVFNKAQVAYYDKNKSLLATTTPYDSTASIVGTNQIDCYSLNTNSSARYARVILLIGTTAGNSSGLILVDDVWASDGVEYNSVGSSDITLLCESCITQFGATSSTWAKYIEYESHAFGEYRIAFTLSYPGWARIYRNGTAVGTARNSTIVGSDMTFSEDVGGWQPGDLIQLYGYNTVSTSGVINMTDLKIMANTPTIPPVRLI